MTSWSGFARRSDKQRIAEHFDVLGPSIPDFGLSYNMAPQIFQPFVRAEPQDRRARGRHDALESDSLLVKGREDAYTTINAKAETVATTPAFREAFPGTGPISCLPIVYEWVRPESGPEDCRGGHVTGPAVLSAVA